MTLCTYCRTIHRDSVTQCPACGRAIDRRLPLEKSSGSFYVKAAVGAVVAIGVIVTSAIFGSAGGFIIGFFLLLLTVVANAGISAIEPGLSVEALNCELTARSVGCTIQLSATTDDAKLRDSATELYATLVSSPITLEVRKSDETLYYRESSQAEVLVDIAGRRYALEGAVIVDNEVRRDHVEEVIELHLEKEGARYVPPAIHVAHRLKSGQEIVIEGARPALESYRDNAARGELVREREGEPIVLRGAQDAI